MSLRDIWRSYSVKIVTSTSNKDRNTFRLCIDRDDEQNFLNEEIWPQKIAIYRWAFKDQNQGKNEDRNHDKDATVIANCSSCAQSDGGFQPTGQSTPSTSHAATLSLTSCDAAAADVDNDVIQSDTHWADTVDMDATHSTVIVTYNDDAELWKAGVWRFARGCR